MSLPMFVLATLMSLINQVSGTPYIVGGDSPAGTDCSGLASWVANAAADRPIFGNRFNTGNEKAALLARGFQYGTAPNALVIGWNGGHTAVTLPVAPRYPAVSTAECTSAVRAPTRPDSRTTCSCRCRRMARALCLRRRTLRLRRRNCPPRRRMHRPFWSMLWLPHHWVRRPLICRRPATPELRIDEKSNCACVGLCRRSLCDVDHTARIMCLGEVK